MLMSKVFSQIQYFRDEKQDEINRDLLNCTLTLTATNNLEKCCLPLKISFCENVTKSAILTLSHQPKSNSTYLKKLQVTHLPGSTRTITACDSSPTNVLDGS